MEKVDNDNNPKPKTLFTQKAHQIFFLHPLYLCSHSQKLHLNQFWTTIRETNNQWFLGQFSNIYNHIRSQITNNQSQYI